MKSLYVDYKMLNSQGDFSLENILENLLASGVDEILVKPVLMSDGYETKRLRERLLPYRKRFSKIEEELPVLGSPRKIELFADFLIEELGFNSEYEYCLVGHGLENSANKEYSALSESLHSKGFLNVEVACLTGEGNVYSYLSKVQEKFKKNTGGKGKPVQVYPLLINAGIHVKKDIFGLIQDETGKKSFVQILEENGLMVVKNPFALSHFELFRARYLGESKNSNP